MNTFLAAFLGCVFAMLVVDVARVQIMTALVRRATKKGRAIVPPAFVPCELCKRTQAIPSDLTVAQAAQFLGEIGWRVFPIMHEHEIAQVVRAGKGPAHATVRVCPICALALAPDGSLDEPTSTEHEDLSQ